MKKILYYKIDRTLVRDGSKSLDYIYINIIDKLNERRKMLNFCLLTNDSQPTQAAGQGVAQGKSGFVQTHVLGSLFSGHPVVHPASTASGQSLQPPLTQSFFKGQQKWVPLHCAFSWHGLQNSTLSAAVHSPAIMMKIDYIK